MRAHRTRFAPFLTALALALLVFEGAASAASAKKVDLNTASQKELEELPGVGEATAKKIIAGRPYSSVSELSKAGVPEKTISKISKMVTVSGGSPAAAAPAAKAAAPPTAKPAASEKSSKMEKAAPPSTAGAAKSAAKVDLNTASEKELEELPGVGPATAKKIVAGRPYSSAADLSRAGVSKSTIEKISPMVTASASSSTVKGSAMAPAAGRSAPASAPPPAAPPAASSAKKTSSTAAEAAAGPPQQPPVKGMVWVNTETKVFHREGDHWYGNTKQGKFMTEADAIKAGYRESKQKISGQ
jgi:DNA uptake protein ComE-like DNA-binding protein